MIKKSILLTILLNINLFGVGGAGDIVSDPGSYAYYMQQITQVTKQIDLITTQIKTLGGIRTVIDETKKNIYNAKDNLENVMGNMLESMETLTDAMRNTEIKSLWSIKRSSIGGGSGGLMYDDISEKIRAYFKVADDEIIERMGGKQKLKELEIELYTFRKALDKTNLNDFKAMMATKVDDKKINQSLLISKYLEKLERQTKDDIKQDSFANVQENYNSFFHPTAQQKYKREKNIKRLKSFTQYIESSDDLMQQTQTSNLILLEILNILNKEYKSALRYRNAIATLHIKNINNPAYLARLVDNQKKIQEDLKNIPYKRDTSKYNSLKRANALGVGFRF
ncbi:hypothetical protein [Sulfurimonas sp.]|uniref:hypothetical protein n=1 Tax=Sulfurimonas sp. TaxID=2022749 RepID=UPI002B46C846|nr:hypothetical protein [Sulfurimonas sp.]